MSEVPTAVKVILTTFSVIFLVVQIVAFIFACYGNDALFIVPTIIGIGTGCLGIFAGVKQIRWAGIMVIILALAMLIWYGILCYLSTTKKINKDALLLMEQEHECCGQKGPKDYQEQNLPVPDSCYPKGKEGDKDSMYQTGCLTFFNNASGDPQLANLVYIIIMSIVCAALLILSFCMFAVCCPCFICCSPCCLICLLPLGIIMVEEQEPNGPGPKRNAS